jgi:hypothetical protein
MNSAMEARIVQARIVDHQASHIFWDTVSGGLLRRRTVFLRRFPPTRAVEKQVGRQFLVGRRFRRKSHWRET